MSPLSTRLPISAVVATLQQRQWPTNPTRFNSEINAFSQADRNNPPPRGGIVFLGSSTIRLWSTLEQDYPGYKTIRRGFGGSQLPDSTFHSPTIVAPYEPRQVVLFAGSNDISAGRAPSLVAADFRYFVEIVRSLVPRAHIAFIEITSSPSRWSQRSAVVEANALISSACKTLGVDYIPVRDKLLGVGGLPRNELFAADRLHLSAEGYRIMAGAVRPFLKGL